MDDAAARIINTPAASPAAAEAAPSRAGPLADGELVQQHHRSLWRYLRVLGASPDEADDLAQEAFVVLLRAPFVDRGPAAARTWLRTTARQLFLAHCRRQRRMPVELDDAAVQRALAVYEGDDDGAGYRAALARCLSSLPVDQRRLIEASAGRERPLADLAAARRMHPEALRALLRRCKALLRDCVLRRLRLTKETP